ncbi:hypothetical protein PFISCL1PPCAC_1719, partial [Pristionchus fissidentatus]
DELRDRIQKFQQSLNISTNMKQRHLLTMLARYSRIHKHFVQMPNRKCGTAKKDFRYRHQFPDPAPEFDEKMAIACSNGTESDNIVMNCLEHMAAHVIPKTNWANTSIDLL